MTQSEYPKVSVLLPCYNQESFIRDAIMSALEQDYPNIQIVVSDDASKDGTPEIVKELAAQFPEKIIPILQEKNLGVTENCNRALAKCDGKYVALHAGDDIFLPGKIRKQVEWLEGNPDKIICYHDMEYFDSDTGEVIFLYSQIRRLRIGGIKDMFISGGFVPTPSVMLHKNVIPKTGYDVRIKVASDWLFLIECVMNNKSKTIGYVDGVYSRYRRHRNNISNQTREELIHEMEQTFSIVLEKKPEYLNEINQAKAVFYLSESIRSLRTLSFLKALSFFRVSLKQSKFGFYFFLKEFFCYHKLI